MKEWFKLFLSRLPKLWISVGLVSLIAGLIFGLNIGVYTFMGIGLLFIAFICVRQLWWFFTKTGDFTKIN